MHFDPGVTLAGFIVGIVVGMTGMGGGALMTPILVLIFGITPLTAVSSDLVASMIMKPIGSAVHVRKGTVRWELVKWLAIGSVPFAFAGVFVLRAVSNSDSLQGNVKIALGGALVLAAALLALGRPHEEFARRHHHHLRADRAIAEHAPGAARLLRLGSALCRLRISDPGEDQERYKQNQCDNGPHHRAPS